jgi:hypothetical protein
MMYKSTKFEVCQLAKSFQDIVVSIFLCPVWPLDLWPQDQSWSSTFHDVLVYKVWSLSSKGFSRYWIVSIFICPVWLLDLWTSKSIVVIYFSWCTSLQNFLKSVKLRVLKILSCHDTHMSILTPWTLNLKINRGHLLFRMYQCILFEVCLTWGSQDIEGARYFSIK